MEDVASIETDEISDENSEPRNNVEDVQPASPIKKKRKR